MDATLIIKIATIDSHCCLGSLSQKTKPSFIISLCSYDMSVIYKGLDWLNMSKSINRLPEISYKVYVNHGLPISH